MLPMALQMWYGVNIHDSILSTPHPSSQHSSAPLVTDPANKVGETPIVGNQSEDTILPTSDPSFKQYAPDPQHNTSDKLKKAWGMTWSGLKTALWLLEKSADVFPPLKSAVSGLVTCLDLAQVSYGCGFNTLTLPHSHRR